MQQIKIKIQISDDDHIAFGPGKAQLLAAIAQYGSISAAAKSMNMSYKRAWELVAVMNQSFKEPLVSTAVGGASGGGATLTEFGISALAHYQSLQNKSAQFVNQEAQAFLAMLVNATSSIVEKT